jgi:hypothetical protein
MREQIKLLVLTRPISKFIALLQVNYSSFVEIVLARAKLLTASFNGLLQINSILLYSKNETKPVLLRSISVKCKLIQQSVTQIIAATLTFITHDSYERYLLT